MIEGRKDCRSGDKPCRPASYKEALHCQINHSAVERVELALLMGGIAPGTLGAWGNPNDDRNMPGERIEELLRLTPDNKVFATYVGALQKLLVSEVPEGVDAAELAELCDGFSSLLRSIGLRADGTTPEEAQSVTDSGTRLMEAIAGHIRAAVLSAASGVEQRPSLRAVGGSR